jgi:hypothetical protein
MPPDSKLVYGGEIFTLATTRRIEARTEASGSREDSEAPYRFYVEARYHYAPTKNMSTHFMAITLGIRY